MSGSSSISSNDKVSNIETDLSEFLHEDNGGSVIPIGAYDPSDSRYAHEREEKSRKREMIRKEEENKQVKKFKEASSKISAESDNVIRLNFQKKRATLGVPKGLKLKKPRKKLNEESCEKMNEESCEKMNEESCEKKKLPPPKNASSLLPVTMYSSSSSESDSDD